MGVNIVELYVNMGDLVASSASPASVMSYHRPKTTAAPDTSQLVSSGDGASGI